MNVWMRQRSIIIARAAMSSHNLYRRTYSFVDEHWRLRGLVGRSASPRIKPTIGTESGLPLHYVTFR